MGTWPTSAFESVASIFAWDCLAAKAFFHDLFLGMVIYWNEKKSTDLLWQETGKLLSR